MPTWSEYRDFILNVRLCKKGTKWIIIQHKVKGNAEKRRKKTTSEEEIKKRECPYFSYFTQKIILQWKHQQNHFHVPGQKHEEASGGHEQGRRGEEEGAREGAWPPQGPQQDSHLRYKSPDTVAEPLHLIRQQLEKTGQKAMTGQENKSRKIVNPTAKLNGLMEHCYCCYFDLM